METNKCPKCGADLIEGAVFCGECGANVSPAETPAETPTEPATETPVEPVTETPVETTAETPAEPVAETPAEPAAETLAETAAETPAATGKNAFDFSKMKKYVIPAGGALGALVVLIIILTVILSGGSNYTYIENDVLVYPDGHGTVVFVKDGKETKIDGYGRYIDYSLDRSAVAVIISEEEDYYSSDGSDTIYIFDGELTKVPGDIQSVSTVTISDSGKGLTYFKPNYDDDTTELYLWSNGKTERIATGEYFYHTAAISPDGKTVAYAETEDGETAGYYYTKGERIKIGKEIIPVAVSDNAKYIYYDRNDSLYVQKGNNEDSRQKLSENVYSFFLNKDYSQIFFHNSNRAYISNKGGEKITVADFISELILPVNTAVKEKSSYKTVGVDTFAGTFFNEIGDTVMYITKKFEGQETAIDYYGYSVKLSTDEKTLIFENFDGLAKIDGTNPKAREKQIIKSDEISEVWINDNGSQIYFENYDDEILFSKNGSKPKYVGEFVDEAIVFKNKLYYISDGEFFVSGGKKASRITGFDDDEFYSLETLGSYMLVETELDGDYYTFYTTDGKKYTMASME
ncbi:MAG: zinc-ribbon domain-containing protein [Ruminococcus sp.]|jgi:uncharacterized Zn finger protein (UPF0148 family)|nr:zinc-ribbon domain-containing protein [Ruminococcus sp.]